MELQFNIHNFKRALTSFNSLSFLMSDEETVFCHLKKIKTYLAKNWIR